MRLAAAIVALSVPLATACGVDRQLEAGFEQRLGPAASCDGFIYSASADESLILVFRPPDPIATIADTTSGATYDYAADNAGILYVETGEGLATGFCSDTTSGDTDHRYQAIEGTAAVTASAGTTSAYDVSVTFTGILFAEEFGERRVPMPSLQLGTGYGDPTP